MLDFSNFSGCIDPTLLETGDLLFVGRLDAPTLMGKPPEGTPTGEDQEFLDFLLQLLSGEAATRAALTLLDKPSLMSALKNHLYTVAGGYYSGHVGMVIVDDSSGTNIPYVIEAGTQSYCNYRVALHPYYVASEDDDKNPTPLPQMRGWANRRFYQQDRVWLRRYKDGLDKEQKTKIANYAKSLLGRPYGVFDSLEFADDSRLYCSDFAFKCYKEIQMDLDDRLTWDWFFNSPTINNLGLTFSLGENWDDLILGAADDLATLIGKLTAKPLDARPPAFSLPMLYYSNQLSYINYHNATPLKVRNSHNKIIEYGVG